MRFSAARFTGLLLGATAVLSACASSPAPSGAYGAGAAANADIAPTMVIERFLRAANQNDLDTMATLFGTAAGPVTRSWPRKEIDDRMFLIASLVRHSDYTILGEQIVPGRRGEATLYNVRLVGAQGTVQVPFTLVLARKQWLIEQIGIERLTNPNRRP
jgi:hypothetical protein